MALVRREDASAEEAVFLPPQWECVLTGGVMGEALASRLFRQLLSAMEFLHLNKVAHRLVFSGSTEGKLSCFFAI